MTLSEFLNTILQRQIPLYFTDQENKADSRDWSLGHAGDEGPHLSMTGESRGFSRGAPQCAVSHEVRRRGQ